MKIAVCFAVLVIVITGIIYNMLVTNFFPELKPKSKNKRVGVLVLCFLFPFGILIFLACMFALTTIKEFLE
jgi:nitrate/nitrite transporter NarK